MPLAPADWRKTEHTHRIGTRASQPSANTVTIGTLYFVTDEFVIERSNGTTWDSYSGATDPLITSTVVGGTAAGSDLTLKSTNNGSPSGDEVKIQLEDDSAIKFVRNPSGGIAGVFGDSALKYTFAPANSNQFEFDIFADINFNLAKSLIATTGVTFQTYNDAVNANIPLEFRGHPIIFSAGTLVYNSNLSFALSAGNNNDMNPGGIEQAQVLFTSGDAGGTSVITGIVPTIQGNSYLRILSIFNFGTSFVVSHNNAASAAANRFFLPNSTSVTLVAYDSLTLLYHTGIPGWVQLK